MEGPLALGHGRQTRDVTRSLPAVEGVEQPAVEHRLEPAPEAGQLEHGERGELDLEPPGGGLPPRDRERGLGLKCQPHDRRLGPADVPRRRAVPVRCVPGESRQPFVAGGPPAAEGIARGPGWLQPVPRDYGAAFN